MQLEVASSSYIPSYKIGGIKFQEREYDYSDITTTLGRNQILQHLVANPNIAKNLFLKTYLYPVK